MLFYIYAIITQGCHFKFLLSHRHIIYNVLSTDTSHIFLAFALPLSQFVVIECYYTISSIASNTAIAKFFTFASICTSVMKKCVTQVFHSQMALARWIPESPTGISIVFHRGQIEFMLVCLRKILIFYNLSAVIKFYNSVMEGSKLFISAFALE